MSLLLAKRRKRKKYLLLREKEVGLMYLQKKKSGADILLDTNEDLVKQCTFYSAKTERNGNNELCTQQIKERRTYTVVCKVKRNEIQNKIVTL